MHKPSDLLLASSHKDCLQLLKGKIEFIAGIQLDLNTQVAQDRVLKALIHNKVEIFRKRFSVSLSIPITVLTNRHNQILERLCRPISFEYSVRFYSLQIETLRKQSTGRHLSSSHLNKLKLVLIPIPASTVDTKRQLNYAIQGTNATYSIELIAIRIKIHTLIKCFNANILHLSVICLICHIIL